MAIAHEGLLIQQQNQLLQITNQLLKEVVKQLNSIELQLTRPVPGLPGAKIQGPILALTRSLPSAKIRFWQTTISSVAKQILWADVNRLALLIFNPGVTSIQISNDPVKLDTSENFILAPGLAISIDNYIGEIWSNASTPVTLSIIEMKE